MILTGCPCVHFQSQIVKNKNTTKAVATDSHDRVRQKRHKVWWFLKEPSFPVRFFFLCPSCADWVSVKLKKTQQSEKEWEQRLTTAPFYFSLPVSHHSCGCYHIHHKQTFIRLAWMVEGPGTNNTQKWPLAWERTSREMTRSLIATN